MGNQQTVQQRASEIIRSGSRLLAAASGDANRYRAQPLSSMWSEIRGNSDEDNQDDNGFLFNGLYVPEGVLELLLSYVRPTDILKVSLVSLKVIHKQELVKLVVDINKF